MDSNSVGAAVIGGLLALFYVRSMGRMVVGMQNDLAAQQPKSKLRLLQGMLLRQLFLFAVVFVLWKTVRVDVPMLAMGFLMTWTLARMVWLQRFRRTSVTER